MSERPIRAAVLYWSAGGNTRKVAEAIAGALDSPGVGADLREIAEDLRVDYAEYDLVFLGAPVYAFLPPPAVTDWLRARQREVEVVPSAPERPGRAAVVFCTYGGPHTGVREAVPMLKYVGQFFEHAGVRVVDEWAVVGEFHAEQRQSMNVEGRLGDIRGRPNKADLAEVRGKVAGLLRRLYGARPGGGGG